MWLRVLSLTIIIVSTASCSREITNPCSSMEPVSEIQLISNSTLCFESIDSYDLNYKGKKTININGELFLPNVKAVKYNAVILTHGSGGKEDIIKNT